MLLLDFKIIARDIFRNLPACYINPTQSIIQSTQLRIAANSYFSLCGSLVAVQASSLNFEITKTRSSELILFSTRN